MIVITKNRLTGHDAELLAELAAVGSAAVFLSIPTIDGYLEQRPGTAHQHPRPADVSCGNSGCG